MEAEARIRPDDEVYQYLREIGYSPQQIDSMNMNTRLFHDLGSYGDTAEDEISLLQKKFGVDLSEFNFHKYFPAEFDGKNKFQAFILNITTSREARLARKRETCEPLTLSMINRSIRAKRWIS